MKQLQHYNLKIPKTEKVCRPSVSPVIICVIPVVKVNKEAVIDDISNRGDADKSRILSVDCLQFHPHPEPTSLKDRQGIDRYLVRLTRVSWLQRNRWTERFNRLYTDSSATREQGCWCRLRVCGLKVLLPVKLCLTLTCRQTDRCGNPCHVVTSEGTGPLVFYL